MQHDLGHALPVSRTGRVPVVSATAAGGKLLDHEATLGGDLEHPAQDDRRQQQAQAKLTYLHQALDIGPRPGRELPNQHHVSYPITASLSFGTLILADSRPGHGDPVAAQQAAASAGR